MALILSKQHLINRFIDILLTPTTKIVNFSHQEGSFPLCFKTAYVSPLVKKTCLDKNIISKIIEKAVAKFMTSLLKGDLKCQSTSIQVFSLHRNRIA